MLAHLSEMNNTPDKALSSVREGAGLFSSDLEVTVETAGAGLTGSDYNIYLICGNHQPGFDERESQVFHQKMGVMEHSLIFRGGVDLPFLHLQEPEAVHVDRVHEELLRTPGTFLVVRKNICHQVLEDFEVVFERSEFLLYIVEHHFCILPSSCKDHECQVEHEDDVCRHLLGDRGAPEFLVGRFLGRDDG